MPSLPAPDKAEGGTQEPPSGATPMVVSIGIVDDHPIVRRALKEFLGAQPDFRVRVEVSSIAEILDRLRVETLDVLMLDLGLPGRSGLDGLAAIRRKAPRMGVLVYSGYPEAQYGVKLMRQGAGAYLHKSCDLEELATAIRVLATGRRYLTPTLMDMLASQIDRPSSPPHAELTDRELQVLLKLARGTRLLQIADQLALSVKTVSFYRTRVLSKLDLGSNGDLTYYALKHQLLD